MTDQNSEYAPELLEILTGIARDERSTLLAVPPLQALRELAAPAPPVSPRRAGLSDLERLLLEQHREELAYLLRAQAAVVLLRDPWIEPCVTGYTSTRKKIHVPSQAELRVRLDRFIGQEDLDTELLVHCRELQGCFHDDGGGGPSATQLTVASLRIAPSDNARINAALGMFSQGHSKEAIDSLRVVLTGQPSDTHASLAWQNIGLVQSERKQMGAAHDAYVEAARSRERRGSPLLSAFVMALQLGDRGRAELHAARIADTLSESHESVELFVRGCRERRARGRWAPTDAGVELARSLLDRLDSVSVRCAHVML